MVSTDDPGQKNLGPECGIFVQDEEVRFRDSGDSLRVMLAQISPCYDQDLIREEGLVRIKDPERQARRIVKIIEHAVEAEVDLLLFPELTAPFSYLEVFEDALRKGERDLVTNLCYEHTEVKNLLSLLSEEEKARHGFGETEQESGLVNFCRIAVKVGPELKVYTQMKLTPYSSEFSLSAKETLICGRIVHKFVTNWGNFLFLICKDYVGEVRTERRVPMFDFLKSLTSGGLHYVFVSALNTEPEAFIHAARAFYYLQEKSAQTFTLFLNTAELDHTTVVFPVRPHPKVRAAGEVGIRPLFDGKPAWGTQVKFQGRKERVISGRFVRLDRYTSMPTKEIFSPIYETDLVDLSALGIESEVFPEEKTAVKKEAVAAPAHNLPPQPTKFVGREDKLKEMKGMFENPACRLVTLVGPGGIGKTRLALQAASELIDGFSHGVYFVPLAPLSSADFLVSTVGDSLKFSFYGHEDPKVQLFNYLREKNILLIMDNFEHLVEGAALIAEILESAPGVKMIVTSRERLNLKGEWILEVQGMGVPESEETGNVEEYSAVQLFVQSAQRVRPGFTLLDEDRPCVIRICQLVQGMPLGIELASAWTRLLSCKEVAQEIEKNLDFLATSMRDMPERHRSMRAVFEHSWHLLADEERDVFMKMSVFGGGFRRDAAEKVAGAPLLFILSLVNKSLLLWTASDRYEMHELLRQYADEKLTEVPGEKEKIQKLHCEYYAQFLRQREESLTGEKQKEVLQEIGEEIENVREAWSWAVEQRREDAIIDSLGSLYLFYGTRSWFQEGEEILARAVARLEEAKKTPDDTGGERQSTLGRLLARQGIFCETLSRYEKGREVLQRSLEISREVDDKEEIALSLRNLGLISYYLGEYGEAKKLLHESLEICREIDNREGVSESLNHLGLVSYGLGDHNETKELFEESLSIRRELGDRRTIARSLINLGNVSHRLGEYERGKELYQESLTICREIDDQMGIASSLNNLGNASYQLGDREEARQLYRESLAIKREIGHRKGIAASLGNLGNVAYQLGEYVEAKELHTEELTICKEIGHRQGTASSLNGLGYTTCALEDYEESRGYFLEALRTAMDIHGIPLALDILVGMATLMSRRGEKERALEFVVLTQHHPATYKETRDAGERLCSELSSEMSLQAVADAQERGQVRKLEDAVAELLKEETATD